MGKTTPFDHISELLTLSQHITMAVATAEVEVAVEGKKQEEEDS